MPKKKSNEKFFKSLETRENGNTTYQNLQNASKAILNSAYPEARIEGWVKWVKLVKRFQLQLYDK